MRPFGTSPTLLGSVGRRNLRDPVGAGNHEG